MPKGLGDNPLKRERKRSRHTSLQPKGRQLSPAPYEASPLTTPSVEASPGSPSLEGSSSVAVPGSRSYNSVFFERRSDVAPSPPTGVTETATLDAPAPAVPEVPVTTVVPEAATQDLPVPEVPEVPEVHEVEPPVDVVSVAPIAPTEVTPQTISEAPAVEVAPPVESPAVTPSATPAPIASAPAPVHEPERKSGFFGRFFGKFKKSQ